MLRRPVSSKKPKIVQILQSISQRTQFASISLMGQMLWYF